MRARLHQVKITPRLEVWAALESRLTQKEKPWPVWLWWLDSALVIVVIFLFFVSFPFQKSSTNAQLALVQPHSSPLPSHNDLATDSLYNDLTADNSQNVASIHRRENNPQQIQAPNKSYKDRSLFVHKDIGSAHPQTDHKLASSAMAIRQQSPDTVSGSHEKSIFNFIEAYSFNLQPVWPSELPPTPKVITTKKNLWNINMYVNTSQKSGVFNFFQLNESSPETSVLSPPQADTLYNFVHPQTYLQIGVNLEYFFAKNWSIEGGLGFMLSEQAILQQRIYLDGIPIDSIGPTSSNPRNNLEGAPLTTKASFKNKQLYIPLIINRYFSFKRSAINLSAGAIYSFRLRSSTQVDAFNSSIRSLYPFTSDRSSSDPNFNFSQRNDQLHLIAKLSYQYRINPSLSLYAGPHIRYATQDEFSGSLVSTHRLWYMGLEAGLKWHLGKR